MKLMECEHLTLAYEGIVAVSHLDFSVEEKDYLCIIGDNGTGKSTLMRALLGLKRISGGSIRFAKELKVNQIGYLAQQTEVQKDFPASVWEVVLSGFLNQKGIFPFYKKTEKEHAEKLLNDLGISHLRNQCYRELSGGQQQRVLLARALLATDKVIVLDEPTTGLDPGMTTEFFAMMQKLNQEYGVAIIMTTHDTHCAVKYAKHILHLTNDGYFFGSKTEYLQSDLGKQYIGGHRHD